MRVWVIRVPRDSFVPSRRSARLSLERARRTGRWTVGSIFGLYVTEYERRFRREWPFTVTMSQRYVDDLEAVIQRVGVEEARRAVGAVFALRWVKSDHMGLLRKQDLYARFVIPALEDSQPGEQAEWAPQASGGYFP